MGKKCLSMRALYIPSLWFNDPTQQTLAASACSRSRSRYRTSCRTLSRDGGESTLASSRPSSPSSPVRNNLQNIRLVTA